MRHIDGAPIRKLAAEVGLGITQTYEHIKAELKELPLSNFLTASLCSRFCGILIVDAKYIKARGYRKKIAFIWAIDYLTHDIVATLLAPSENHLAYLKLFSILKRCGYSLQIAVADDHGAIYEALMRVYPKAHLQLCHVHYLENIRKLLRIRTEPDHLTFFLQLKKLVFDEHTDFERLRTVLQRLLKTFAVRDSLRQQILKEIYDRRERLFAYTKVTHCPKNTNLIELYNSHLNARIRSIKGFKSYTGALRWLNGYVIWRRTKKFTDCRGKFRHLNHHCSLELTIKKQALWPDIIGLSND